MQINETKINEMLDRIDNNLRALTEEVHVWRSEQREICSRHMERIILSEDRLSNAEDTIEERALILQEHAISISIGKWIVSLLVPTVLFLVAVGVFQWFHKGDKVFEIPKEEIVRINK